LPWGNDLTPSPEKVVPSLLTFAFLLGSSPLQTILTTGTLLRFTSLAATNLANEGSEECHGDHPVAVRAFEHVGYYPKQVSLCQGEIVVSGPFSGSRRVFVGRLRGVGTDKRGRVPDSSGHYIFTPFLSQSTESVRSNTTLLTPVASSNALMNL